MEANAALYCDCVSQPVTTNDIFNVDTESPTDEDDYLNTITDPQLIRWEKYLECLKQGAWGDHISIQGIALLLNVKINVLSSEYTMFSVSSRNCSAVCEVLVGLIMQYLYVDLDKIPVHGSSGEQSAQDFPNSESMSSNTNVEVADDALVVV